MYNRVAIAVGGPVGPARSEETVLWKRNLWAAVVRARDKEIIKLEKFVVTGGKPLRGEVVISGAKNAAVAIVPAALLADGPVRLENVPKIIDVTLQMEIMLMP